MILFRLLFLPVRLGLGTTKLGFKTGYRTGRFLGYRRQFLVGIGVGIGLLVAPGPGRELRARLREMFEGGGITGGPDPDLGERVRFELSHHPRTWHLPQPQVAIADRRVRLTGDVPDEDARHEMVRAVAALPGVAGVEDELQVSGTAVST